MRRDSMRGEMRWCRRGRVYDRIKNKMRRCEPQGRCAHEFGMMAGRKEQRRECHPAQGRPLRFSASGIVWASASAPV